MKVAIAGYGIEGKVNFSYWSNLGAEITIADERDTVDDLPKNTPTILGEGAFEKLDGFELVVRTASLRPDKIRTNGKVWSATNEFFAKCPAPIIGVTGTKGKGTTCSLIASILQSAGRTVHLVGNIGVPALGMLTTIEPTDMVVFELSSFQLWDIEKSPQTAVILKIEPDHMDVHRDVDEYVTAKAQITRYMSSDQNVYYHPTYEYSKLVAMMYGASAKRYDLPDDGAVFVRDGVFMIGDKTICGTDVMQIPGEHNIENACAAISAVYEYTQDEAAIERGLASFTGLPHRLKFIHEVEGVRYFDDSYSSAPSAAIAAIRAHSEPQIILLGGYDKGAQFGDLARELASSSVKKAIIYGQTRHKIAAALAAENVANDRYVVVDSQDFDEIVSLSVREADAGDVVVLSPACASFDMFKNFTQRGEAFIRIVEAL